MKKLSIISIALVFLTAIALLLIPVNNQLIADDNLNKLNYDNLFEGKCGKIKGFTKRKIDQIFDLNQCKYGELRNVRYSSGGIKITNNHIVPIFMISPEDGHYNSTFIHMLGGPGDSIKTFNSSNYFESMLRIVNEKKVAIIWIGYSGILERSSLTSYEIEVTKFEAQEVIKILHENTKNINIIAFSLGAYIFSSISNDVPKVPVTYVSPLLGSPHHLKQYVLSDNLSKTLFLKGIQQRWKYNINSKLLYGHKSVVVKAQKLFDDYYGKYVKVDNFEMFNQVKTLEFNHQRLMHLQGT